MRRTKRVKKKIKSGMMTMEAVMGTMNMEDMIATDTTSTMMTHDTMTITDITNL